MHMNAKRSLSVLVAGALLALAIPNSSTAQAVCPGSADTCSTKIEQINNGAFHKGNESGGVYQTISQYKVNTIDECSTSCDGTGCGHWLTGQQAEKTIYYRTFSDGQATTNCETTTVSYGAQCGPNCGS